MEISKGSEIDPPIDVKITETTENYLKRIYILATQLGEARLSDVAKTMGRSLSSTSEAVKRMVVEGYLDHKKYGGINLTEKGKKIAEDIHDNYISMHELLNLLGIPDEVAVIDACSMEHSISSQTIDTIKNFIRFITSEEDGKELLQKFNEFNNYK